MASLFRNKFFQRAVWLYIFCCFFMNNVNNISNRRPLTVSKGSPEIRRVLDWDVSFRVSSKASTNLLWPTVWEIVWGPTIQKNHLIRCWLKFCSEINVSPRTCLPRTTATFGPDFRIFFSDLAWTRGLKYPGPCNSVIELMYETIFSSSFTCPGSISNSSESWRNGWKNLHLHFDR